MSNNNQNTFNSASKKSIPLRDQFDIFLSKNSQKENSLCSNNIKNIKISDLPKSPVERKSEEQRKIELENYIAQEEKKIKELELVKNEKLQKVRKNKTKSSKMNIIN